MEDFLFRFLESLLLPVLVAILVAVLVRLVAGPIDAARSFCRIAVLFSGFFLLLAACQMLICYVADLPKDLTFELSAFAFLLVLPGFLAVLFLSRPPRPTKKLPDQRPSHSSDDRK